MTHKHILILFLLGLNCSASSQVDLGLFQGLIASSDTLAENNHFKEAITLIQEAEAKSTLYIESNPKLYVEATIQHGKLLVGRALLAEADSVFQVSQETCQRLLGKSDLLYSQILVYRSAIFRSLGKYKDSELLLSMSKPVFEPLVHARNQKCLSYLIEYGNLCNQTSRVDTAEMLFTTALKIVEETQFTKSENYTDILMGLGATHKLLQNFETAITYLDRALLSANGSSFSDTHAQGVIYSNIGGILVEKGDFLNADSLLMLAKSKIELTTGKQNTMAAAIYNNIGRNHYNKKEFKVAEENFIKAKDIYERIGIQCERCYVSTLNNLARVSLHLGDFKKGAEQFSFNLNVVKNVFGTENEIYLETALNLYQALESFESESSSDSIFYECLAIEEKLIQRASKYFTREEIKKYMPIIFFAHEWMSGLTQYIKQTDKWFEEYYNAILFRKGFLLESTKILNHGASSPDKEANQLHAMWMQCHRQLASEYSKPISERTLVDSLQAQVEILEQMLVEKVAGFFDTKKRVTFEEVKRVLKPNTAAIEFVHYKDLDNSRGEKTHYAALVLLPEFSSPKYVYLFSQSELEKLTKKSKSWITDYTQGLYAYEKRDSIKNLYELLWAPLDNVLKNTTKIYYASSGELLLLNLNAIENDDKTRISDILNLHCVSSTRELAKSSNLEKYESDCLVFGGITYSNDYKENIPTDKHSSSTRSFAFDFNEADSTLRKRDWVYLNSTVSEVENISNILAKTNFAVKSYSGSGATEETFKQIGIAQKSPRILHIATHGFFFPDPQQSHATGPVFKTNPNPMMRSGLILAGANYAWKHGKPLKPDMEDGILTAYEISLMDLSHTELVVLSACETGLGDIAGNEGVYGLQRAFKIAGAKYLIMSLWKVPDVQTEVLMTLFYQKWLEDQMPIPEAFRAAQGIMRKKYPNPYYWAGFILQE